MIKHVKNIDLDKKLWDKSIDQASNGIIYAYSWYLDIVTPGWDALVYNNYEYVFPLVHKKKIGIQYIYPPLFVQHLEVYGDKPSYELLRRFLNNIPHSIKYVEMNLAGWNLSPLTDFEVKPRTNIELQKAATFEELFNNFSKNHRRNINKAKKNKLLVTQDDSFETTSHLFNQNKGASLGFNPQHYKTLHRLMKEIIIRKKGYNYLVFKDNEVCAGAFFTLSHQRMIFLFSGLSQIGRDLGAMHLLINDVICKNYLKFEIFDFEGSNDQNLAKFYLGFGGKSLEYHTIIKNRLPWYISWLK